MDNFQNNIPSIIFGILGLSITIATFLPALVYSYNKDLLKNLSYPKWEEDENVWKRVLSFIFTNDLLLTQSMIQVFFSSIYSILIFSKESILYENNIIPNCIFFLLSLLTLIFHWKFAFSYSKKKIGDFKNIKINDNDKKIVSYWSNFNDIIKIWKRFMCINLIITSGLIFYIFVPCFRINHNGIIIYFMSYLSLILISFSVSWLIPLLKYSPLQSEAIDYIKYYEDEILKKNEESEENLQ